MGGGDSASALLLLASREVQVADHLLSVTYPMAKEPKLLLRVADHGAHAIEAAAHALVRSPAVGPEDLPQALPAGFPDNASPAIASAGEAADLHCRLRSAVDRFKGSPTSFSRGDRLIIADEGFGSLLELTPEELSGAITVIKRFVHDAGRHVIIGGA